MLTNLIFTRFFDRARVNRGLTAINISATERNTNSTNYPRESVKAMTATIYKIIDGKIMNCGAETLISRIVTNRSVKWAMILAF